MLKILTDQDFDHDILRGLVPSEVFDGIIVLGYDKYREEHYSSYRSGNVWGILPLRVEGAGDNKIFTVQLRNTAGQMEDKRFVTSKDAAGRVKVIEPSGIDKVKDDK